MCALVLSVIKWEQKCSCCNDQTGGTAKAWPGNSFLLPISSTALAIGII